MSSRNNKWKDGKARAEHQQEKEENEEDEEEEEHIVQKGRECQLLGVMKAVEAIVRDEEGLQVSCQKAQDDFLDLEVEHPEKSWETIGKTTGARVALQVLLLNRLMANESMVVKSNGAIEMRLKIIETRIYHRSEFLQFCDDPRLPHGVLRSIDFEGGSRHSLHPVRLTPDRDAVQCENFHPTFRHPVISSELRCGSLINGTPRKFNGASILSICEVQLCEATGACKGWMKPHKWIQKIVVRLTRYGQSTRVNGTHMLKVGLDLRVHPGGYLSMSDIYRHSKGIGIYANGIDKVLDDRRRFHTKYIGGKIAYVRANYKVSPEMQKAATCTLSQKLACILRYTSVKLGFRVRARGFVSLVDLERHLKGVDAKLIHQCLKDQPYRFETRSSGAGQMTYARAFRKQSPLVKRVAFNARESLRAKFSHWRSAVFDKKVSKKLTLILRYTAVSLGFQVHAGGFVSVADLEHHFKGVYATLFRRRLAVETGRFEIDWSDNFVRALDKQSPGMKKAAAEAQHSSHAKTWHRSSHRR